MENSQKWLVHETLLKTPERTLSDQIEEVPVSQIFLALYTHNKKHSLYNRI